MFIALTEFARGKFIQGGLLESKVVVKPNFIHKDLSIVIELKRNELTSIVTMKLKKYLHLRIYTRG